MEMVHVTIQTARFEEEIQFYEKYVGLTIKRDMRGGDMDIVFMGDETGSKVGYILVIANPKYNPFEGNIEMAEWTLLRILPVLE